MSLDELNDRLNILLDLQEQAKDSPDWEYGVPLVRDSYFEEFARDEADDLGLLDKDSRWPYTCIDWQEAAEELQQDYFSVEFDGVTYWIRS